jgi:tetratricopeptide (TPR) repeat protein
MRMRRTITIVVALLVMLGIGWFIVDHGRHRESEMAPQRLKNGPSVSLVDRLITVAEAKVRRLPKSVDAYTELSAAFMRKARETGDSSYYVRAQAAGQKGLELEPENYAALRQLAWIYNGLHEFQKSLAIAEKARDKEPQDPWNYGMIGDALIELGQYERAAAAIQKMVDLRPDTASYSRAAYLRELYGDLEGAIQIMNMALNAASSRDSEMLAWCATQLGNLYLGGGQLQAAEQQFTWALQVFPNYFHALLGMGRACAAQKKFHHAVECYKQSIAIAPQTEAVAELGDIYSLLGRREEATRQYELIEAIEQINRSNQVQPDAWLAMFYADHDLRLDEAVKIAQRQAAQRKDIQTYDALAWAYYKVGRYAEAEKAMAQALRLGTKVASYFYHAGMIKSKLGQVAAARQYLRRALELNPVFHPVHAEAARATLKTLS